MKTGIMIVALDNKLLYRGCSPMPSPDGYLLMCGRDASARGGLIRRLGGGRGTKYIKGLSQNLKERN